MKVFGIGLTRSGTSSLSEALRILKYDTRQFPSMRKILTAQWIKKKELKRFEAFTDVPVAVYYPKLDQKFPGSKFILTMRDEDSWIKSCAEFIRFEKHYPISPQVAFLRRQLYGSSYFVEDKFSEAIRTHHANVHRYFANREQDLLVLNICQGDGWKKLCEFLGKDIPDVPFPARNMNSIPDNLFGRD